MGSHTSSYKTSAGIVKTGPGILHEIHLAAGVDAATATVYDNTAASGTILARLAAVANGNDRYAPKDGIPFGVGVYVAFTGTTPTADIAYD
jgi:hypothetical protein